MSKTKYRGSYKQHNEFGYFCIGCHNFTRKKYYLKKMEDNTGIAWRCPHCGIMFADWVLKNDWENMLNSINSKKGSE